jgi:hypothetical protein
MNRISKEQLLLLRKKYTPGKRVELLRMNDPYSNLSIGAIGTVISVDDIGTIHVRWDSGSSLGIVYGEDYAVKIIM